MESAIPDTVTVTGQEIDTTGFSDQWRQRVSELTATINTAYQDAAKSRYIVAIAGPSGTSKSTTAAVLHHTLNANTGLQVLHVNLDAYHYPRSVLRETLDRNAEPLLIHKGRFDTYDTPSLQRDLALFSAGMNVIFPEYSRVLHDPVANQIECSTGNTILILEGLWLLFDAPPWRDIAEFYYDLTFYFHAPEQFQKHNTIARHERGGRTHEDSVRHYRESDAWNAKLITQHVIPHDHDVYWEAQR